MEDLPQLDNSCVQDLEVVGTNKEYQLTDTEKLRKTTFKSKIPVIKRMKRKGNTKSKIITKELDVEKPTPKMIAIIDHLAGKPTFALSPQLRAQEMYKRSALTAQDFFRLRVPKPTKLIEYVCHQCIFYSIYEPRYRKPLVVLDLDTVRLIYPAIVPNNMPTILDLLEIVYRHFDIAVWSSTPMFSLIPKLEGFELFKPTNKFYISFVLDTTAMYSTFLTNDIEVKDMEVIWNIYPQYNEHNSILVDNYLKKIIYEIYQVSPSKNTLNEPVDETALRVVMDFLEEMSRSKKSFWSLNTLMFKRLY